MDIERVKYFKKNNNYLIMSGMILCICLLLLLNLMNNGYSVSYSFNANSIFIVLTLFLYCAFYLDKSTDLFSPWKIFIYSFFAFYVFHVFSTQFTGEIFYDYPYEYKTPKILLKSANLFLLGSIMFFLGYRQTYKIRVSSLTFEFLFYSLNNKSKLILYNYIIIVIAIVADFYNSYIYMGSILARLTTNYSSISLGSLSLLLYLYPIFLTNTFYILLKYKIDRINKTILILLSIFVIAMQLFSGTRSFIFGFVIASLYLYKYKYNEVKIALKISKIKEKINKFKIIILMLIVYLSNVIMQLYRQNKNLLDVLSKMKLDDVMWKYDTIETYLIIIRQFPEVEPYKYFYSIKNLLVWIIPRRFYEGKSIAFGKYLAYLIWPSFDSIPSAYAGITVGEFYANYGVVGMMVTLLIIGFISGIINQLLGENKVLNARTLLYSYIVIGLYGFYRGDFTTKTVHLILPFVVMLLILVMISPLFPRKCK